MIPSIVARQVRETIRDYLETTFALADPDFERALFDFLDSEAGLFKGPYVDVRLPFRKAEAGERIPLDIRPGFEPYKHQLKAFQRLYSKDGHQPQHTLVTTGTGSGKTECFLYPVLDHCWRHRDAPGVKAILLYPMNALASDQARRLAATLWDEERLRGQVTAGLYVGGKGQHGADESLWMTQALVAGLFQTTPQNITQHLRALYQEGEIEEAATCKEYLQVREEGGRQVRRSLKHYNLDAILAVGYRVRSSRGTQFRRWATERLREFLVKGFTLDDERLRRPPAPGLGIPDYFDELLERIRDIRASEARMYLRVREIFALAADYDPAREDTAAFFRIMQNKLHFAATGMTVAELIAEPQAGVSPRLEDQARRVPALQRTPGVGRRGQGPAP